MFRSRCSVVKARLQEIVDGLARGARLPSERDLASTFGVSRSTVRNAVDALLADGRIDRDRRRGMFVADPKHVVDLGAVPDRSSWPHSSAGVTSRVVRTRHVTADEQVAADLRIRPGDLVGQADRLLAFEGRPMAVDSTLVPDLRCPGFVEELVGNMWPVRWLRDEWDITLSHTETSIASEVAHEQDAFQLGGAAGQPLLVVQRIGYDDEDRPVLRSRERYRGDRVKLVANMVLS